MLGGLMRYLRESEPRHFQPMNSNFGLVDPLEEPVRKKEEKREKLVARARADFAAWIRQHELVPEPAAA
jgi:methylenetetrahydrofolate--tRNA-(uracil-5-)-methyltransferase